MPAEEVTFKMIKALKVSDEVKGYIIEMTSDEEFMEHFGNMFDYAREVAEESFISLRTRQLAVRNLIKFLSNLYW